MTKADDYLIYSIALIYILISLIMFIKQYNFLHGLGYFFAGFCLLLSAGHFQTIKDYYIKLEMGGFK